MNLQDFLRKKKASILKRWFQLILETYPADASGFLKKEKDRFANPVGHSISSGIEALYEELLGGRDPANISRVLDEIIRVRAVQDFSPSRAIGFIFYLKKCIREELGDELRDDRIAGEFLKLESRIDNLALLSFDIYMKCREKMYEIRANEVKNRTFMLLERAGLVCGIPETEEDSATTGGDGLT